MSPPDVNSPYRGKHPSPLSSEGFCHILSTICCTHWGVTPGLCVRSPCPVNSACLCHCLQAFCWSQGWATTRLVGLGGAIQQKWSEVKVAQLCPPLCDPRDYIVIPWNSPGQNTRVSSHFPLHRIFPTQELNRVSCIAGRFFTNWAIREAPIQQRYFTKTLEGFESKKNSQPCGPPYRVQHKWSAV